eukprot:1052603-Prymnesium_polylepis.2
MAHARARPAKGEAARARALRARGPGARVRGSMRQIRAWGRGRVSGPGGYAAHKDAWVLCRPMPTSMCVGGTCEPNKARAEGQAQKRSGVGARAEGQAHKRSGVGGEGLTCDPT